MSVHFDRRDGGTINRGYDDPVAVENKFAGSLGSSRRHVVNEPTSWVRAQTLSVGTLKILNEEEDNAPQEPKKKEEESKAAAKDEITMAQLMEINSTLLDLCAAQNVEVPEALKTAMLAFLNQDDDVAREDNLVSSRISQLGLTREAIKKELEEETNELVVQYREYVQRLRSKLPNLHLTIQNGKFTVAKYYEKADYEKVGAKAPTIPTVFNSNPIYAIGAKTYRMFKSGKFCDPLQSQDTVILDDINLSLQPGKMYLVLGGPGSGKSSLLKYIADTLPRNKNSVVEGSMNINKWSPQSQVFWSNLVGYCDQIERLHPYLTVLETIEFAWKCKSGSTHYKPFFGEGQDVDEVVKEMDDALVLVHRVLEGLGLAHVEDTFVGNQDKVRGVSGGQRRRVTFAEMIATGFPVLCCDEISTGLDSATTFDIIRLMARTSAISGSTKLVSLLQPPPETFSLFDGLILLSEGKIIYNGPVEQVVDYFSDLGYEIPDRMDVADWLMILPTKDGEKFLRTEVEISPTEEDQEVALSANDKRKHLTAEDFKQKFDNSDLGKAVVQEVQASREEQALNDDKEVIERTNEYLSKRFYNSGFQSLKLLINRELVLWRRDMGEIWAQVFKDIFMGLVIGTLFFQGWENQTSVMGVLFQSMMFLSLGAMIKVPDQFDVRGIFYKHQDANFYPTWTYVVARSLASLPMAFIDAIVFGSLVYWMVGLAFNDGASVSNYFIFLLIIMATSFASGLLFSIFAATVKDVTVAKGLSNILVMLMILFSGFTVQAKVIPSYWIWAYWCNIFAWLLRALVVNEYQSGRYKYEEPVPNGSVTDETQGEFAITELFGYQEAYEFEWVWWGLLFSLGIGLFSVASTSFALDKIRFATGMALDGGDDAEGEGEGTQKPKEEEVNIPIQRADLTFRDIRYSVIASTSKERLELLKGIDGVIASGKMTALMGSSGAGKTTLMDVLALRKSGGEISGEVCLNGHPQEPVSFRRCTGYVEQFDVQSAQLTVRETVEFSAKLRLEESNPAVTIETTGKYINQVLNMLELDSIADMQVGSDVSGGLSFEERKRLSIAVELAANPSILFLDEPTSGLDSRAAAIVVRGLRRVASTGRAVCATIHQPSIAVFHSFDSLLLLKRGGEVVFCGDIGKESCQLISYFERYVSTPRIEVGENPATWMLVACGAGGGSSTSKSFDYAGNYRSSDLHKTILSQIEEIVGKRSDENRVAFSSLYATSTFTQTKAIMRRTANLYWRSPNYNVLRLLVSAVVAVLFGSVYVTQRVPATEADMLSRVTSIFVSSIFLAVNGFNTVLTIFEAERNMYYRHKASLMYDNRALIMSFTIIEIPFIMLQSLIFLVIFYFMIGLSTDPAKFGWFYLIFTLNMATFTFLGQMFMAITKTGNLAQNLGSVLISLSGLLTGVLIQPQNIPAIWTWGYWLFPGHYVLEGLMTTQFEGDQTPIDATPNSAFFISQGCTAEVPCEGPAEEWVTSTYVGWTSENAPYNCLYLITVMWISRMVTWFALTKLNFRST